MRVSCSSDGDQLLYNWTLNGDSLMDGNSSIDLDEGTDGNITCSVKNHVSHGQTTIRLVCPTVCSMSVVFVLVWCFQVMVLFGLLGGFHIYMRHTSDSHMNPALPVNVTNLVGDLQSAHHQMSRSPCHNTQTVAPHPGLHSPSFSALIGSTPVTDQRRYKSPGLSPCRSRSIVISIVVIIIVSVPSSLVP
ncbi:hypothetical protein M9458_051663 [Cirrhinus mrigala]|uniref:Ig-like domain-containing protein n=1 Tax=Cirrhinus mrigala TaxID=683832 RepID=A0ABD0MSR0_CIRMR